MKGGAEVDLDHSCGTQLRPRVPPRALTLVGLTLRVEQMTCALSRCGLGVTMSSPATTWSTSEVRRCSSSALSTLSRSSTVEMAT